MGTNVPKDPLDMDQQEPESMTGGNGK